MARIALVICLLLVCVGNGFARASHCGTSMLIQHSKELRANPSLGTSAKVSDAGTVCQAKDYYDSVYSKKTEHFQIFYTTSGPHKTTQEFIDTLATAAEYAWKFHTKSMGMLEPLGVSKTHHYQKSVESGLYPIEVIDIDNLRDSRYVIGGVCHGCFGVAVPERSNTGASELYIDNDFRYTPTLGIKRDTVNFSGKNCAYTRATEELINDRHGFSYVEKWNMAIRVTAIHELYHSVQLRYLNLYEQSTFWFEASASGIEEIAASDIDDYYSYLPNMFSIMGTPLDGMTEDYGAGIFFMYMYNYVDKGFDKFVWESFNKEPGQNFQYHLNKLGKKKKISIDSVFHDFSKKLAFAGTRSKFLDSTKWVVNDQYFWPDFNYIVHKENDNSFEPWANELAYEYHIGGMPELENYKGKASIVLFKNKNAEVLDIASLDYLQRTYAEESINPHVDSIGWIFSRFTSEEFIPLVDENSKDDKATKLHAYPTPWRSGNLCFSPLPEDGNFIEIRNRRGDLITRKTYNNRTFCIDETTVKSLMAPGIYKFRAGSSGKLKDFLIIY